MDLSLILQLSPDSQIDILLGQFVATPASVIPYANAAAASAASANLSMTNAGLSATSATGSATNAATSATQAATSASNAAGSASAAAVSAAAASLITNAAAEVFNAGTGFTPGVTTSITLAGSYGSVNNILVTFDDGVQRDCTLVGHVLGFNPTVPVGISQVIVSGGRALAIGTPADGTVGDTQIAPGSGPAIILNKVWTLKRFGAKVDGVTDDTSAVINAFKSGQLLITSERGDCLISGTIPVVAGLDGFKFQGPSRRGFRFMVQNANLPAINVPSGMTGVELENFSISRVPAATAGGDGISWLGSNSKGFLSNILAENCWRGFALGPTDYAKVIRCIAQQNYSYGLYITNIGVGGACQWSLDQCLSQTNNNHGMFIDSSTGTSGGLSLGEISQFSTFANAGKGIVAIGSAANPINGLRILGGFAGQDADDEIYLDTYGGQHKIIGIELELAGTIATGRNLAIPVSNIGHGMSITANNGRVQISDPNINGCSASGIATFASVTSISNPHITNNGLAPIVSDRNGVLAGAGRTSIVGGYIADTGSNTQQFGVSAAAGSVVHLTGTDLTGNVVGATTGAGTIVSSNCFP